MSYNFSEAHILRVTSITTQAGFEGADALTAGDLAYIGLMRQESGYTIEPEQEEKSSVSDDLVLTWKLNVNLECLTTLDQAARDALDGKMVSLLVVSPDFLSVDESGQITISGTSPTGTLLAPVRLHIKEEEKFGTGKVTPIVLTGGLTKMSKSQLRKSVTLSQS
ncbi:MAG: hypothetical protein Kow0037_00600 [Calditrichia bacterium]